MTLEVALTLVGIVGPALLLVVAVRRWSTAIEWRFAGLLLAITLAFLGPAAFTSGVPVPLDEMARGLPYRAVVGPVEVANPLVNETARQILPWMQVSKQALLAGRAPLWNRYSYSGYPLLANAQSAPFSPYFLATLFVPLPQQIVAMAGLEIFVALLFVFLLLRSERLGWAAATLGAAYFSLSVFQTVWLYYPMSAVTSLLPALLFSIRRVTRSHSRGDRVLLALITAGVLAGGHPERALHVALGGGLFLLVELTGTRRVLWTRRLVRLILPVAAGVLIAAPAWLPFAEQLASSQRFAEVSTSTEPASTGNRRNPTPRMPLDGLAQMVNPDHFGHPARKDWTGHRNYAETAPIYLGLVPLALLIVPLLSPGASRHDRWLLAALALTLLVAFHWTPVGHWLNRLPLLSLTANSRLRFVAVLFAAILAARSLERLRLGARRADSVLAVTGCLAALAAVLWLGRSDDLSATLVEPGAAGLLPLAGLGIALALPRGLRSRVLTKGLLPLVLVELYVLCTPFNAVTDRRLYRPQLPIVEALRAHAAPSSDPFRIVGAGWYLLPDGSTWYGLEDIRGNDAMVLESYSRFLDLVTRTDRRSRARLVNRFPQPGLDFLNVRYVMTPRRAHLGEPFTLLYRGPEGKLWHNPRASKRFYAPRSWRLQNPTAWLEQLATIEDFEDQVLVDRDLSPAHSVERPVAVASGEARVLDLEQDGFGSFRLRVEASAPALIASSLPHCRGWTLEVNQQRHPIRIINGAFVGFYVDPGESWVWLRYQPDSFRWGVWMFFAGLLLVGAHYISIGSSRGGTQSPERPKG